MVRDYVSQCVVVDKEQLNASPTTLSQATGIDQSDISKIERGVANPSIGTLNRIAKALDAKLSISIA